MARTIPNPETIRPGTNGDHLLRTPDPESNPTEGDLAADGVVGQQIHRLANGEGNGADELEQLRADNAELRRALGEAEGRIEELSRLDAAAMAEQLKEFEALLDEKSEVIRALHRKNQELQDRPPVATPREEELLTLSEELERERRQLKEDEDGLMKQMQDMEVQMARERAEMARQRNELQRLHSEIRHELELAARDATLRERLAPLQRRHQDLTTRRGGAPAAAAETGNTAPAPAPSSEPTPQKESGLFRRLFG